jgi:transcriptional regulator with XRE-family HTH domain
MMEQGERLRAWRAYVGEQRGRKLTLEEAAELIAIEAERLGIGPTSRKVPRTHASLTRWELGNVSPTIEGLAVIAAAYHVNAFDLMTKDPPTLGIAARASRRPAEPRSRKSKG